MVSDIDNEAIAAMNNEKLFREFLFSNKKYIMNSVYRASNKYITESDDEWSVALMAFAKAVKTYDINRGSFLSYADIVIKRMLTDYYRAEKKFNAELSVNPSVFDCEPEEDDADLDLKLSLVKNIAHTYEDSLKYEIEAANEAFNIFGFSFYDLYQYSPKSQKTKASCKKAVLYILKNDEMKEELFRLKRLPINTISENTEIPRKILERHRIYIIAATVILSGEYPGLAEYVLYIKKDGGEI